MLDLRGLSRGISAGYCAREGSGLGGATLGQHPPGSWSDGTHTVALSAGAWTLRSAGHLPTPSSRRKSTRVSDGGAGMEGPCRVHQGPLVLSLLEEQRSGSGDTPAPYASKCPECARGLKTERRRGGVGDRASCPQGALRPPDAWLPGHPLLASLCPTTSESPGARVCL